MGCVYLLRDAQGTTMGKPIKRSLKYECCNSPDHPEWHHLPCACVTCHPQHFCVEDPCLDCTGPAEEQCSPMDDDARETESHNMGVSREKCFWIILGSLVALWVWIWPWALIWVIGVAIACTLVMAYDLADQLAAMTQECDALQKELAEERRKVARATELLVSVDEWMEDDSCDCGDDEIDKCTRCMVRRFLESAEVAYKGKKYRTEFHDVPTRESCGLCDLYDTCSDLPTTSAQFNECMAYRNVDRKDRIWKKVAK